ncbi:hypothetical protein Bp8pS_284 [Bacillus phage vB_BpuM-BpSp]|nr:hypothetical protein Bp8pS_284 [Bacillus phage vB_BpuM-BpSp]
MNENNALYNKLTNSEDNTENFLKSLRFKKNGFRIIEILKKIDNYDIVKGFDSNQNPPSGNFKSCTIKLFSFNESLKFIKEHPAVESVNLLDSNTVEFTII